MYPKGVKGLLESCDGLEIVAKVYSVSRSIGMCLSQLDHPSDHEAHPDLCFVSQWVIRWFIHTQVPTLSTPVWGKST